MVVCVCVCSRNHSHKAKISSSHHIRAEECVCVYVCVRVCISTHSHKHTAAVMWVWWSASFLFSFCFMNHVCSIKPRQNEAAQIGHRMSQRLTSSHVSVDWTARLVSCSLTPLLNGQSSILDQFICSSTKCYHFYLGVIQVPTEQTHRNWQSRHEPSTLKAVNTYAR